MVIDCIIIQEVFNEEIIYTSFYCPGGRYTTFHSGSLLNFYMVTGCNITQYGSTVYIGMAMVCSAL